MTDEIRTETRHKRGRPRKLPLETAVSNPRTVESEDRPTACDGEEEALAGPERAGTIQPVTQNRGRGRPKGSKNKAPLVRTPDRAKTFYDNKRRSTHRTIAEWMALRGMHPNMSNKEIAATIGITTQALYTALKRGRKAGSLKLDEPLDHLRYNVIPKAVENLGVLLDQGDKTATLETMKGTLFPAFRAAEGAGELPNMVLAIKIDMPDQTTTVAAVGSIVGKPRELQEVIDVEP